MFNDLGVGDCITLKFLDESDVHFLWGYSHILHIGVCSTGLVDIDKIRIISVEDVLSGKDNMWDTIEDI